eukprot:7816-Heterococcus_DN1.PRE.7
MLTAIITPYAAVLSSNQLCQASYAHTFTTRSSVSGSVDGACSGAHIGSAMWCALLHTLRIRGDRSVVRSAIPLPT